MNIKDFSQRLDGSTGVSGSNRYGDTEEWGESVVRREAEAFVDHWHNAILRWQAQLRSEPKEAT